MGGKCIDTPCCAGLTCCLGQPANGICANICPVSDRNMKRDFAPVDRERVLQSLAALPISTWSYKAEESQVRHIGPMAQDFMSTFHVGSSDKTIFQLDADGVAFAAIQALNDQVKRLEKQNAELRAELGEIRAELHGGGAPARAPAGRVSKR
jgi:hypothetical protein